MLLGSIEAGGTKFVCVLSVTKNFNEIDKKSSLQLPPEETFRGFN